MPQVFQVLRCCKCLVFQVHQTKKSNKWECKLCGEKQSIKIHYGLGTGKECRLHVQKLNGIRGEIDELSESYDLNTNEEQLDIKLERYENIPQKPSKWSNFVDKEENLEENNDSMFLGNTEVVLEVPKKKRKFNNLKVKANFTKSENNVIEPSYHELEANVSSTFVDNSNPTTNCFVKPFAPTKTLKVLEKHSFNISKSSTHNKQDNIEHKTRKINEFVPPKVNKNSKWAQFTEDVDAISPENVIEANSPIDEEQDEKMTSPKKEVNNIKVNNSNLFSLCDEDELDNVLAF